MTPNETATETGPLKVGDRVRRGPQMAFVWPHLKDLVGVVIYADSVNAHVNWGTWKGWMMIKHLELVLPQPERID